MLYIIEGPDKCGKSTFIDKQITHKCEGIIELLAISNSLNTGDKVSVHFDDTDKDPVESLKICAALSLICDIYMDRSWISDCVYGPVYRGEYRFEPRDRQYIVGLLQNTPHIVYYFDTQIANSDTGDKYEQDVEKIELVKFRYKQIMSEYKDTLNIYKVVALI